MKSPNQIAIEALTRYELTEHQHGTGHMTYYDKTMDADSEGEWIKRADVLAALTPPAQGSIDTPEFRALFRGMLGTDGAIWSAIVAHIDAVLADRAARQSAAPAVQGGVDIESWASRLPLCPSTDECITAMEAEIADLRAALAQRAAVAEVAKPCRNQMINDGAKVWPKSCYRCGIAKCPVGVEANFVTPTASTPPAPVQSAAPRNLTFGLDDSGKPVLNDKAAPAPSEPVPSLIDAISDLDMLFPDGCQEPGALVRLSDVMRIVLAATPTAPALPEVVSIPGLDEAFMTMGNYDGVGRTIMLKFNQREDAYETYHYLIKAATPVPPAVAPEQSVSTPSEPVPQGVPENEPYDYPYDALFRAIGDAAKIESTAVSISVSAFVKTLASKGYYVAPTAPTATSGGEAVDELVACLRQFQHNDCSGFVFGYDKKGVDKLVAHLKAKASPNFESADDLIVWLDKLHATEGAAITNRKWEPAQRAIAALAPPSLPATDAASVLEQLDEGEEVLGSLIGSVERHGNYSQEATITFLGQVRQSFSAIRALISKETT